MTNEKWSLLKRHAEKTGARFIRCGGVIYEVTSHSCATGPSPLWSVEEVIPVDVPYLEDVDDFTKRWPIIENDTILS